jgi:hypothetical protein
MSEKVAESVVFALMVRADGKKMAWAGAKVADFVKKIARNTEKEKFLVLPRDCG